MAFPGLKSGQNFAQCFEAEIAILLEVYLPQCLDLPCGKC